MNVYKFCGGGRIMFAGLLRTKIINSDVDEVPLSYVIKNW